MLRLKSILIIFYCLAVSFAAFGAGSSSCAEAFSRLTSLIDSNRFETQRGIEEYIELFPDSFLVELAKLNKHQHWIDAGSGEGYASLDFFQRSIDPERILAQAKASWFRGRVIHFDPGLLRQGLHLINTSSAREKPKVTAVTYHMEKKAKVSPEVEYKVGKFFEDISTSEFKPADLITDLFGVMSYSPQIDVVLKQYHDILKLQGKAYIYAGDFVDIPTYSGLFKKQTMGERGWFSNFALSQVKRRDGSQISLIDWISSLPGFESSLEERVLTQPPTQGVQSGRVLRKTLILKKTNLETKIPRLRLVESDDQKPPLRVFEEIDPFN
ncbi:MAG: hypothetical protein ACKOA8_06720 [Deltaproteobacteria bacterium]